MVSPNPRIKYCYMNLPEIFKGLRATAFRRKVPYDFFENCDFFKNSFYFCVHPLTENWWSVLEPPLFLKIVELFKEVVVHLLKLYKIGIPPSERRIFNSFLHTALKVLEILHRVCSAVPFFPSFLIATDR